jgi:hypothetical protein
MDFGNLISELKVSNSWDHNVYSAKLEPVYYCKPSQAPDPTKGNRFSIIQISILILISISIGVFAIFRFSGNFRSQSRLSEISIWTIICRFRSMQWLSKSKETPIIPLL